MCGRFALFSDPAELAAQFSVSLPPQFAPRYNIAPSQPLLAIRHGDAGRAAALLDWGLVPSWSKDPRSSRRPINARAETVAEKPSFRAAWRRRRCLVPADGYYEWSTTTAGKQPVFITPRDGRSFAIAGLWEYWEHDGSVIESCALLTCAANGHLARIHHRMPVVIEAPDYARWLGESGDAAAPADLLRSADDDRFSFHSVSKRVNSPANEGVENIHPQHAAPDHGA